MVVSKRLSLLFVFLCGQICSNAIASSVSPLQFGYLEARSGEERYDVLFKTHSYAKEKGIAVDYSGLERIYLTIPKNPKPIPLSPNSDFKGSRFYVVNNEKDNFPLFVMQENPLSAKASFDSLGGLSLKGLNEYPNDDYVITLTDCEPWVLNRKGYNYGSYRKDVLLKKRNHIKGKTVYPYTQSSSVDVSLYKATSKKNRLKTFL